MAVYNNAQAVKNESYIEHAAAAHEAVQDNA